MKATHKVLIDGYIKKAEKKLEVAKKLLKSSEFGVKGCEGEQAGKQL